MARPSPVPPYVAAVVDASPWANTSKMIFLLVGRNADAGIAHREVQRHHALGPATSAGPRRPRAGPGLHADAVAAWSGIQTIAFPTQVDRDLRQATRIADQERRGPSESTVACQLQVLLVRQQRPGCAGPRSSSSRSRNGRDSRSSFAAFYLVVVEDVVDQREQPVAQQACTVEEMLVLLVRGSVSSASVVIPMMPLSGVRSSWLMLARNALSAWLAPRPLPCSVHQLLVGPALGLEVVEEGVEPPHRARRSRHGVRLRSLHVPWSIDPSWICWKTAVRRRRGTTTPRENRKATHGEERRQRHHQHGVVADGQGGCRQAPRPGRSR